MHHNNLNNMIYNKISSNDEITDLVNNDIELATKIYKDNCRLKELLDDYLIVSETDVDGVIIYVSEAFCKINKYPKNEILGTTHKILRDPQMPDEVFLELWYMISNGQVWHGQFRNRTKEDTYYWADVTVTPRIDKQNNIIGYTAIYQDITDQKEAQIFKIKAEQRTSELEKSKKETEAIFKHTQESIEYASLIQGALIPNNSLFKDYFKDYFTHWEPKDIVGGDIYFFQPLNKDEALLMVIDCTGHGVPGAFVTMLVKAIEKEIVGKIFHYNDEISPSRILSTFNRTLKQLLKQENSKSISNAGFDGGIIYYNKKEKFIKFAGAETPLFYIDKNKKFTTIRGSRHSVGYKKCRADYIYKEHIVKVEDGMQFYVITDGYLDQTGGPKDFPFGRRRFRHIIEKNFNKPMQEQKDILLQEMVKWEKDVKDNDRCDDITMVGFAIEENTEKILFKYNGLLTQGIIVHTIEVLEHSIKNMKIMSNIITIVIELTQNMMNYSKTDKLYCEEIKPNGFIEVSSNKGIYYIKTENIVSVADKEKIEPILKKIQISTADEIKKQYKYLRRTGKFKHQKGGGLGFYEIAKKSQKIKFNFKIINKDKMIFEFEVIVS